jgi:hypothetical protein
MAYEAVTDQAKCIFYCLNKALLLVHLDTRFVTLGVLSTALRDDSPFASFVKTRQIRTPLELPRQGERPFYPHDSQGLARRTLFS